MSIHEMTESQKLEFLTAFRTKFGFGEMTASASADAQEILNAAAWAWQASRTYAGGDLSYAVLLHERAHFKAENERLQRFEIAYKEFSDKTDWVRPNAAAHELGMHVADIIRKRCDDLTSHCQAQADEILRLRKERAELVIELPQQSGANLEWNQAIRYCHQAIEAADVKVKP